jgi:carbon storage regulator
MIQRLDNTPQRGREVGEQIVINGDICITLVAIRGDRVRLGITAPRETVIDRREVHERRIGKRDALEPPSSGDGPV